MRASPASSVLRLVAVLAALSLVGEAQAQIRPGLVGLQKTNDGGPLVAVKLKCGFEKDGSFVCKNVKNEKDQHKKDKGQGGTSGAAKCRGKNSCPPGYRDLDIPNKYGACCEQVAVPAKPPEKPQSGGCRSVTKMSEMSCAPPFSAMSCSALQNGRMTCCCVK